MKTLVLGVLEMIGKSAKTGAPYEMRRLLVASPVKGHVSENYVRRAAGYECVELECEPEAIEAALRLSFPKVYEIETDMKVFGGKLSPVAVAIREIAKDVSSLAPKAA